MAGIEHYLFGYRRISADYGMRHRLVNAFLTLGICAVGEKNGDFIIRESDYKALSVYSGGRVRFSASEPLGLPARLKGLRTRLPTLVATVLVTVGVILLSGLVWDVRLDSESGFSESEVREMLEDTGFGVGSVWASSSLEEIENRMLSSFPELAFVHINRRGTVAYVLALEKEGYRLPEDTRYPASNIIATHDGVIDEITVSEGKALVKVGDTVKRGDILISGVIDTESNSYLVRAEGTVRARVTGSIESSVDATEDREVTEIGKMSELVIELFGFPINIFKNYGNLPEGCVIIENEEECLIFDEYRLPIKIRRGYTAGVSTVTDRYDESDLPFIAKDRLDAMLRDELDGRDLIKLGTSGEYTDGGYILRADYVYVTDITTEVGIDLG